MSIEIKCSVCENRVTADGIRYCSQECLDEDFDDGFERKLERVLRPFERQAELCRLLELRYSPGGEDASYEHARSLVFVYRFQAEKLEKILADLKGENRSKVA
jgi:hypothetical protein